MLVNEKKRKSHLLTDILWLRFKFHYLSYYSGGQLAQIAFNNAWTIFLDPKIKTMLSKQMWRKEYDIALNCTSMEIGSSIVHWNKPNLLPISNWPFTTQIDAVTVTSLPQIG